MKSFVVVGGGTAGWMAAAYLNMVFADAGRNDVSVTLVESEDIGVIGVGEATVPTLRQMMQILGVPEWRLIAGTNATFKNGIKFKNWTYDPRERPDDFFYHPFEFPTTMSGYNAMTHWLVLREYGLTAAPFHDLAGVQAALCDSGRSPKLFNSPPFEAPVPYAYHVDAAELGRLLRDLATTRGVKHVVDNVVRVNVTPDGNIASVATDKNGEIAGDFFVDCTGFSALLIEGALDEPFVDRSDVLLCDRAVAIQLPHEAGDNKKLRPYTTSTAKSAGWIWEIDLFSRRGTGHVYSSRFIDDDAAEAELRTHIGPEAKDRAARRLRMRVGHRRRMWVGNCLAVGLSGSFIEPLESTGIYLIETALTLFLDYMDGNRGIPVLRDKYNAVMSDIYAELVDFIVLHYVLTQRGDTPFWRAYRDDVALPETLREKLALWQFKVPSVTDLDKRVSFFGPSNYFYILAGMKKLPPFGLPIRPYVDPALGGEFLKKIAQMRENAVRASPDHLEIVQKLRATAS